MSAVLAMTEREWQSRVVDLVKVLGYRYAHFRPAQTARGWRTAMSGDAGFPDMVIVGRGRLIFAELKGEKTRVQSEQLAWARDIKAAGAECYLWRPAQWDEVVRVLSRPEEAR